jgi:Lhr-like helicase
MNNSFLAPEKEPVSPQEKVQEREAWLVRVIEAARAVSDSAEWSSLKEEVFDGVLERLERDLARESMKPEVNTPELYRLQGQILWARKYADIATLADEYRSELTNVRKRLSQG